MQISENEIILRNQIGDNEALKSVLRTVDEMMNANLFGLVCEFNEKFEVPTTDQRDHQLPHANQRLRVAQLKEEVSEYEEAVESGDMLAAFDALVDLTYFALGTARAHRFPFIEGFNRVHEANMGKRRALRNSDSKRGSRYDVVKPENWQPPILDDLIPEAAGDPK